MKRDKLKLRKHTMNYYDGDWEELRALFPSVETSELIRELVHDLIVKTKAKDPTAPKLNIEVKV